MIFERRNIPFPHRRTIYFHRGLLQSHEKQVKDWDSLYVPRV